MVEYNKFKKDIEAILSGINKGANPHMKKLQLVEDLYAYQKGMLELKDTQIQNLNNKIKELEKKLHNKTEARKQGALL